MTGFVIGTPIEGPQKPKEKQQRSIKSIIYFDQKLDHDSMNTHYFEQRCYVYKNANYVPGNPVYLLVGGAIGLKFPDLEKGLWNNFAEESHALLLGLEHRMYGNSYPRNDKDYTMGNLVYLNTKQALADLAFFIQEIVLKNPTGIDIPREAKWVALGFSYGGTLAALLKSKYPGIITAVVTLDAPLLATVEFKDYFTKVENQYTIHNVDGTVKNAFGELKKGFISCEKKHKFSKRRQLWCVEAKIIRKYREIFKFCNDRLSTYYDVKDHKNFLFWSLSTILAQAVQFRIGNRINVKEDVINVLLDKENTSNALNRLAEAVKLVLKKHNVRCFFTDYKSLIDSYKDTSLSAERKLNYILTLGLGYRQNLYQQCSEWGQFKTADKDDRIFANLIPIDFYITLCKRVFGTQFNAKYLKNTTKQMNEMYGGRQINVSQVLFILRKTDFWINLGYDGDEFKNKSEHNYTILFNGDRGINADEWNSIFSILNKWLSLENTGINYGSKNSGQVSGQNKNELIKISDSEDNFFKKKPNNG